MNPTGCLVLVATILVGAVSARAAQEKPAGAVPLFVENVGQFDARARFQVRGASSVLWLAEDAVWLAIAATRPPTPPSGVERDATAGEGWFVRLSFPAANPHPRLQPLQRSPTRISYFIGNDPSRWHPDVPVWLGVRYVDLYPGIDLELRGVDGDWRPRLVVHPGADTGAVRLRVEGGEALTLDGDLVRVKTPFGIISLPLLEVVTADGSVLRPGASPALLGSDEVAAPFASGARPVAGPSWSDLVYGTYVGGGREDLGQSIALDTEGAAYITGFTLSTDFPTTPGAFQRTCGSCASFYHDAFVSKLSPDGRTLVYSTFLGGSRAECFYSYAGDSCTIAVDAAGSAYVAGFTLSSDYPTTSGAYDRTCNSCDSDSLFDAFVTKLNPSGTALMYSTFLGGSGSDEAHGIALDVRGAAYVTGRTTSPGFPTTPGAFQREYLGGGYDSFVTKLNRTGTGLVYSTFLGGTDDDCHVFGAPVISCGIAVDVNGFAYVTGSTQSDDFPTTPGVFQPQCNDLCFFYGDAYVTKLNRAGSALVYSTFIGGNLEDYGANLALDATGSAFVAGSTQSSDFPVTAGAYQTFFAGNSDAFVTKLSPNGSNLAYSTYLGGSHGDCFFCGDYGYDVAVARDGTAVITGQTLALDFPVTSDAFQPICGGPYPECGDAFASTLSAGGSTLLYSTYLGGGFQDQGDGIALDTQGLAHLTGYTDSADFPVTRGSFQTVFGGFSDAYVSKLNMGVAQEATEDAFTHER